MVVFKNISDDERTRMTYDVIAELEKALTETEDEGNVMRQLIIDQAGKKENGTPRSDDGNKSEDSKSTPSYHPVQIAEKKSSVIEPSKEEIEPSRNYKAKLSDVNSKDAVIHERVEVDREDDKVEDKKSVETLPQDKSSLPSVISKERDVNKLIVSTLESENISKSPLSYFTIENIAIGYSPIYNQKQEDCFVEMEYLFKKTSTKEWTIKERVIIGTAGGVISMDGCKVEIPEGALDRDAEITLELSSKIPWTSEGIPKDMIPIAPTLRCNPPMKFNKKVTVTLQSWFRASNEVTNGIMFYQDSQNPRWTRVGDVQLGKGGTVSFDIYHFCNYSPRAPNDQLEGSQQLVIVDVYTTRLGPQFGSFTVAAYRDEESCRKIGDSLPQNYARSIIGPIKTSIPFGKEISIELNYDQDDVEVKVIPNSRSIKIDQNFISGATAGVYFITKCFAGIDEVSGICILKVESDTIQEFPVNGIRYEPPKSVTNVQAHIATMDRSNVNYNRSIEEDCKIKDSR